MAYILLLLMVIVLLKIAQEDWSERSVHLHWFIALFVLLSCLTIRTIGFVPFITQYFFNVAFIAFQLLLVNLYFCVLHRRWFWIFDHFLGWGDVVFLLAIAGAWSFGGFLLFFIGSLLLILLFALVYLQKRSTTIPLAGLQSVIFLGCYLLVFFNILPFETLLPY